MLFVLPYNIADPPIAIFNGSTKESLRLPICRATKMLEPRRLHWWPLFFVNILKKNILVVDNSLLMLRFMNELLSAEGHAVTCVENALGCLDALVEETPDLIFIDLIMPGIPGDELCRIIRNIDTLQDCYLAIISAVVPEEPPDFKSFGADACIAKGPLQEMRRHLLATIEESNQPRKQRPIPEIRGTEHLHYRQITKELLDTRQHLQIILESMSQGILELTGDRITYLNSKASEILHQKKERLLGSHVSETLPGPMLEQISGAGIKKGLESQLHLADQQVQIEQFSPPETPQSRLILLSDITERKRMEAVIEAANLTKNLGYVFSGIRHEIGNPLNSIKMALSVLQRNLEEYDKETIAEFLDRSLQEVARLEYLLKALKNYSLFERPDMQKVDVNGFINDFIALIRNDFENQQIRIQTLSEDSNPAIWADSRALHHIMLNLVTNAVDALEGVDNPQIIISTSSRNNSVDIKIDDNGKGIAEQDQQHLFKPFFTSKTQGTGLGLVIVKKMLAAMNGTIALESYPGIGTKATITLEKPEAAGI